MEIFLQPDPLNIAERFEMGYLEPSDYRYAFGDPVNFIDPDGDIAWLIVGGAVVGGLIWANNANAPFFSEPLQSSSDYAGPATGFAIGALTAGIGRAAVAGSEIAIGANWRLAPFGNRPGENPQTGQPLPNPLYRALPHYHRRGPRMTNGETEPYQGIGRHRPWQPGDPNAPWWRRF